MKHILSRLTGRSLLYNKKDAVFQIIIVALLSAIITGSLFTGYSVRTSLKRTALEKLGKTEIVISSGSRYFDAFLSEEITGITGKETVPILETDGYCQNFSTGTTALNVKILGITKDFFSFNSIDSVFVESGTVAVNASLAQHLGIAPGDEIIIRFRDVDPLPANAPFAPSKNDQGSKVLKVSRILTPQESGNFSLGITQIIPMNVFINIQDMDSGEDTIYKANRLLVKDINVVAASDALSKVLSPSDIGLTVRRSEKTGEPELISDRIFIDSMMVSDITRMIPSGSPLITYLANALSVNDKTTPYSFVTALPLSLFPDTAPDAIIINRWLAGDLNASTGDTLTMKWYDAGSSGRLLKEKSKDFCISSIVDIAGTYSDASLMPDFPGISGSTTCSGWDAGVPILLDQIREKDEEYWNIYRGTPKAFISYKTGRLLWGNNFGTATAIRFPQSMQLPDIVSNLTGGLDPARTGFMITDFRQSAEKAADESVDFSTLFLGLSFFIIISCIVLFSMAVSVLFDSRKNQITVFYNLGFKNRFIKKLLFAEVTSLSVIGALPGVFLGYSVNILIIKALNSVWSGAVQTDTLSAGFSILPLIYGFITALLISSVLIYIKTRGFLKNLAKPETGELTTHSPKRSLFLLFISVAAALAIFITAQLSDNHSTPLFFAFGSLLFIAMVLLLRYYYIRNAGTNNDPAILKNSFSRQFYFFHPSHAVTPALFIAAGIFAVIITGANRQVISDKMLLPSGGTGGYMLWAESAVPVKEDLNGPGGKKEFGLEEEELKDLVFVQSARLSGDDASCLNLNHVSSPPILAVDPYAFISKGSFSFAATIRSNNDMNPWSFLESSPGQNTIYGIADQTVLQWGLKKKTGDTLIYRAENGQPLNIVICAGLKSSIFQGYLLIGQRQFTEYFPSISGSSVFLIDGKPELSEFYRNTLNERLSGYGFSAQDAGEKLSSFFQVTNTYLNVFAVFGALGMILGAAGLGFVLMRNYNLRRREFALMSATGFTQGRIRNLILKDQILILIWGVLSGTVSGLTATLPSLKSGSEMPWRVILIMIISIIAIGLISLRISVRSIRSSSLVSQLRKE